IARVGSLYLFFHPPRFPGAPPVERGAGPNSGPDCRESVGWMIRLVLPNGFAGRAPLERKGSDSGPCISSRCGLCTLEVSGLVEGCPSPLPSKSELRSSRPREGRGEGEEAPPRAEAPRFFIALAGR